MVFVEFAEVRGVLLVKLERNIFSLYQMVISSSFLEFCDFMMKATLSPGISVEKLAITRFRFSLSVACLQKYGFIL